MGQAGQQRSRQKKICNKKKVKSVKPTVEKKAPKLRKKIQAGQVLILLASKFRGKRVVFLKLESGMLLVTGPFALNGVPLKRVNQRYCIATSTKDCKSITDAYFGKEKTKSAKSQEKFFATEAPKKVLAQEKKKDGQKKLDDAIVKSLGNDVKSYLKSRFSLSANMYPHELKF